jgi:hypothetical protein
MPEIEMQNRRSFAEIAMSAVTARTGPISRSGRKPSDGCFGTGLLV